MVTTFLLLTAALHLQRHLINYIGSGVAYVLPVIVMLIHVATSLK
jgi:hypothetical protein